uniref:Fork-head domain-containing protein n=1 Tax=Scleropages formosus TaxID=113540 RepID=A0A8C9TTJ1_SCLFO
MGSKAEGVGTTQASNSLTDTRFRPKASAKETLLDWVGGGPRSESSDEEELFLRGSGEDLGLIPPTRSSSSQSQELGSTTSRRQVSSGQGDQRESGENAMWPECDGGDPAVKPALSYIALIATVILSSPQQRLNLASIYRDIQERFPYFRARGQGWKNSVRHNLSLNDCFVKLGRCEDGKGSYWGVHPAHRAGFLRGDFRQHRKAGRSRLQRALQALTSLPSYMVRSVNSETECCVALLCCMRQLYQAYSSIFR